MLIDEKKITFDEYMQLPIGAPYQFINGCLVDWPSRTTTHQVTLSNLIVPFCLYEEKTENQGVFLMGPIEVILDDKNSFQPDFVYVAENRKEIIKDYIYGAPDLVVEILWEKNAYYDLRPKKDAYEKYGVKEYIIIDPIAQNADLYALNNGIYYLMQRAEKEESLYSVVLLGLTLELKKLFKR